MESLSSDSREITLVRHILGQLSTACSDLLSWNEGVASIDYFLGSSDGMQKLAGNCMIISAIGEGLKKLTKSSPTFALPITRK